MAVILKEAYKPPVYILAAVGTCAGLAVEFSDRSVADKHGVLDSLDVFLVESPLVLQQTGQEVGLFCRRDLQRRLGPVAADPGSQIAVAVGDAVIIRRKSGVSGLGVQILEVPIHNYR